MLGRSPVLVVRESAKRRVMGKTTGTFQEDARVAGEDQIFEQLEIGNVFRVRDYKAGEVPLDAGLHTASQKKMTIVNGNRMDRKSAAPAGSFRADDEMLRRRTGEWIVRPTQRLVGLEIIV